MQNATDNATDDNEIQSSSPQTPVSSRMEELMLEESESNAIELAQPDYGWAPWRFALCSCVVETSLWGYGFAFGVFHEWYSTRPPFNDQSTIAIAAIGTVNLGLMYIAMPFIIVFYQRYPWIVRRAMWISYGVCGLGLFASSFAQTVWQLILLQGVVCGISGSMAYCPIFLWMGEWFVKRRGLGGGVIWAGTAIGGIVFPPLSTVLLETVDFRWTLRIIAAIFIFANGVAMMFIRPRLPPPKTSSDITTRFKRNDLAFLARPMFAISMATMFAQSLAFFPISLYLTSYVSSLGQPRIVGTIALVVLNVASVAGQVIMGHLADRYSHIRLMAATSLIAALATYTVLGFASTVGLTFFFVSTFGIFAGGFVAFWPAASADVDRSSPALTSLVMSFFSVPRGIAAIVGPSIAGSLYQFSKSGDTSKYGGHGFKGVTLFVGTLLMATVCSSVVSGFMRRR